MLSLWGPPGGLESREFSAPEGTNWTDDTSHTLQQMQKKLSAAVCFRLSTKKNLLVAERL
jgi:hypothetical protein